MKRNLILGFKDVKIVRFSKVDDKSIIEIASPSMKSATSTTGRHFACPVRNRLFIPKEIEVLGH